MNLIVIAIIALIIILAIKKMVGRYLFRFITFFVIGGAIFGHFGYSGVFYNVLHLVNFAHFLH